MRATPRLSIPTRFGSMYHRYSRLGLTQLVMTTAALGGDAAATAAPGCGAPPPPAAAVDTIVLTYCAAICAAFERRPSSSSCTLVGRPAVRLAEKPLCSTSMPTTCSRSRALRATASEG